MSTPVQVFAVIVLVSLPTVMYGGYALLRLLQTDESSNEFRMTYFRAGHAHAGVLLVALLAALSFLDRADLGTTAKWVICILLEAGGLAQAGGMFMHMVVGSPGKWSVGNTVTTVGALSLTAGYLALAYGVATA